MPPRVLDASAILVWVRGEPGAEVVEPFLAGGLVSAANWAEVLQKARQHGLDAETLAALLKGYGVVVVAVEEQDAVAAAGLWSQAPQLSLGDRLCLALARRLGAEAITADRAWAVVTGVRVVLVR